MTSVCYDFCNNSGDRPGPERSEPTCSPTLVHGTVSRMPPSALGCTRRLLKADELGTNSSSERIKCVLVGDGAVGKTSLVVSYSTNGFPSEYIPTAYDNYNVLVQVDAQPISLQLCDTAGQDEFDQIRPLCYSDTDVFMVCFSVVCPTSFQNVTEKWIPEIKRYCPDAAILLVGTQSDRRRDVRLALQLARYGQTPVTVHQAKELARRSGSAGYIETSALTQRDLKEAFDQAIVCALARKGRINSMGSAKLNNCPGKKYSFWKKYCCLT
ncbi:Rho-related GTP-binding protein RhoU [Frankliniella fusca]|uniref:Rho-related GTP-binding protein RhoU n=1 Tax=Frankliniella fusca TaxID=407009 RepID=A0AAE1GZJ0_9NEOP|nr:Rho-related GTP-binding protein RhoU [Frankliniella fusca]